MMLLVTGQPDHSAPWIGLLLLGLVIGFLCYRSFSKSDDRRMLVIKWVCSAFLLYSYHLIASLHNVIFALLYILPSVFLAFLWLPSLGGMLLNPLTGSFDGGTDNTEEKPFYFIAEGKRRKGLYQEAAAAVREQLERFPGDAEGMLKLASIQAEDLRDLPGATATINELLAQPNLPAGKAAGALQTLADWQIHQGRDPAAARHSFERIMQMFPDSPIALAAQQRIAHLEGVTITREFREQAVFKVPDRERGQGLRPMVQALASPEMEATDLAGEYIGQLGKHPNDTETREKLALLYAEQLDRLDLAVGQLEQLAALPNATPKQSARWLGLLATLHIRYGSDLPSAQNALRRIVERFPKSAVATQAATRLATLQGELKAAATAAASKALGAYEKDIGLKSGPGRG